MNTKIDKELVESLGEIIKESLGDVVGDVLHGLAAKQEPLGEEFEAVLREVLQESLSENAEEQKAGDNGSD